MKKIVFVLLLTSLLASCSFFGEKPVSVVETKIVSIPLQKPKINLPPITQLNLDTVHFTVITKEECKNLTGIHIIMTDTQKCFVMDEQNYQNYVTNQGMIYNNLLEQQRQIGALHSYYEQPDVVIPANSK